MRILVAGGGIGGLTTALALRRRGLDCAVYEAGARDRDQGAGLMLAPNALETLRRLGLYDNVRAVGRPVRAMRVARQDGRAIQETDAEAWRQRYGFAPLAIARAALHGVLLDALGDTPVHHDAAVAGFADVAGAPLAVTLADGRRVTGDVLVAADGLRSPIRRRLFGATRFRYAGQTSWRGLADTRLDGELGDTLVELWGRQRGLRFGFAAVDDARTYWFATMYAPAGGRDDRDGHGSDGSNGSDGHDRSNGRGSDGRDGSVAVRERLRLAFAGFVPEVATLLTHTRHMLRTDIFDFAPLPCWHRGRVVLTGDAAHATTPNLGQGANQAVESAFVLARELAERPLDEALASYARIRMPKAHWITRQSWRFGQLTNVPGPLGRWLRYSVVPRAPRAAVERQTDRMFALGY